MHGDVSLDHLDRLVEAYAAASLYLPEVRELEGRLARAMGDLLRWPGTFTDLTSLLAVRTGGRDAITRRVAWAAQHVVGKRAWCVGSRVIQRLPDLGGDAYGSPLLDQLRTIGFVGPGERPAVTETGAEVMTSYEGSLDFEVPQLERIDALCAWPKSEEVWVVKGVSYTQAGKCSPELWVNADRESLFGADDRFMSRLYVGVGAVRSLLAARDLVQAAHPGLKVRACVIVINDPGCSWHFQAHELTSARPDIVSEAVGGAGGRVLLDRFPVLATQRSFPGLFSREGLELATLPEWAGDDPMTALPADRPGRALLLLGEMWSRQVNRPKRLATSRGEELAEAVARTSGVCQGRDQWRHDVEDCLERGGYARRMADRAGRFAITPKGVGRLLVMRRKLGAGPDLPAAAVMSHVVQQARLWAAVPVG